MRAFFLPMPDINISALVGIALLAVGCGVEWGWPAGLIAAGGCLVLGEILGGRR